MSLHDPEQSVAKLLKLSGERDAPSAESMARARAAAEASWQRMLAQRKVTVWSRHWLKVSFALAAGFIGLFVISHDVAPPTEAVAARVAAIEGATTVTTGDQIHIGQQLATENGRIALVLGDALSLRMDQHTKLRMDGMGRVSLLQGLIYIDSGGLNARTELSITTPAGAVQHLGTQFQVSVQGKTTRVRVREGRVQLSPPDAKAQPIAAGEELQIVGSQAQLRRGLSTYGEDWEWSTMIAPALDIENRPLAEFLTWMAREHGWQLSYATESLQQRTHEIRLHGSLESMSSSDALERVSLITGVPITSQDGMLSVGNRKLNQ